MSKLYRFFLFPFYFINILSNQGYSSPTWVQEAVIYCVFPRNFSPSGDLNGVTERLEHLRQLGVNVIWLLPIHPIGQQMKKGTIGSPYCVQDYYEVDSDYGNKSDFKALIDKAHELGMKVIMDVVANHTSWDSVLMQYPEFYIQNNDNQIVPPTIEWLDVAALNYQNEKLRLYMKEMLKYWLKEFDLDGFRLDAASLIPVDFWEDLSLELREIKSDIILLGESDDPKLLTSAFDLDYTWKFEEALEHIISQGASAMPNLKAVTAYEKMAFNPGSLHLRFSDNHDKKRAIVRYGEKAALAASALIFTWDGVPLIHNGMEIGDAAETYGPALFEHMPIFWKSAEIRPEFFRFYQEIIALRKKHSALRDGTLEWIKNSDENSVVTFIRSNAKEEFMMAINFSNQPFIGYVVIENPELFEDVTPVFSHTSIEPRQLPHLALKAWEFRLFRRLIQNLH